MHKHKDEMKNKKHKENKKSEKESFGTAKKEKMAKG
jgi:hypothetical protein